MSDIAPSWQPDPMGKHDHRYWDGAEWTENVADGGIASIDPYVPAPEVPEVEEPVEPAGSTDDPTLGDQPPVDPEATDAYPATVEQPAPWAAEAPSPPPPYVASETTDDGGSKKRLLIGGGILAALVLAALAFFTLGGDDDGADTTSDTTDTTAEDTTETTDTTSPPAEGSYGSDAALDELYDACTDGDYAACDQLYLDAPIGSEYRDYGDTCGDRNEPGQFCVDLYGESDEEGSGSTDTTGGGTQVPAEFEESMTSVLQTLGLDDEQAECVVGNLVDAIESGTISETEAATAFPQYLEDCDVSLSDLSGN